MRRSGGLPTIFLLLIVLSIFGALLWANAAPAPTLAPIIPTEAEPVDDTNSFQQFLREGVGSNSTPLPTIAIPTQPFVAPTLANSAITPTAFEAIDVNNSTTNVSSQAGSTPTLPPPTPTDIGADGAQVTVESVTRPPSVWQPPPLIPPLSRDPART